jgi:hypothetical protein
MKTQLAEGAFHRLALLPHISSKPFFCVIAYDDSFVLKTHHAVIEHFLNIFCSFNIADNYDYSARTKYLSLLFPLQTKMIRSLTQVLNCEKETITLRITSSTGRYEKKE